MKQLFLVDIAPERIPDAAAWVESACRIEGMRHREAYQVKTCVTEAINNAVEHAYGFGAGNIGVSVWRDGNRMVIEISNFVADSASIEADAEPRPDPASDRGRGWMIIRAWADEAIAETRPGRTVVRFAKSLPN
jgi:anti-sigma regulatory factor (Ser/Thr protein kinase)